MTIWINNPFDFLPGEGARLQRYGLLAQALFKAGHQVILWSSDWNHIKKEKREEKCANAGMRDCANGGEGSVEIRLIKTLPYFKNIGLRRLISHCLYAREWERECSKEHEKPDLIICSAPPLSTGWVMRRLCKRLECAGVIDVMDVWPETFERVVPGWMLGPLRWMAKRVYEGADGISAVGDSYLEVVKRYLRDERSLARADGKPMYRCYHGIEMSKGMDERSLARADGPLRLVYVGNMGKGYDLVTLVQVVKEMIDEGYAISLDLAGRGDQEESLKARAQSKTDDIRFHGMVAGRDLSELLGNADVGVIPMFANTYVAVPYKLADYAAAGLPMISCLKGESEALITKYEAGWFYEAGSVASLKRALKVCVKVVKEKKISSYRINALRLAEECFDADKIYPEFVTWLELREKRR